MKTANRIREEISTLDIEIENWYQKFMNGKITKENYYKIRDEIIDKQNTILTTWKEDICKKQNSLIEWLDEECPHGTMTFDLSHDFADILRTKLDQLKNK